MRGTIELDLLDAIGEAIQDQLATNNRYTPENMPAAIRQIHGPVKLQSKVATQNGIITADAGYDGLHSVTVNVSGGGTAVVQPLTVNANGTYTPPTGVDGYAPVTVNVSGGGGSEPQLPSSYQEVEYLATGGSAYITPSIVLNPGTLIKAKATRNSASAQTLIGNRNDATVRWDAGYENGAWYATNSCFLIASNVAGDPTAELLVGLANTVSTGFRYGAYLYSTKYNFDGNLYKLKIYAPTELTNPGVHTLQALFYPCRRIADNVLGFYDAINDVFYPNDGNGTFTPGPDVN